MYWAMTSMVAYTWKWESAGIPVVGVVRGPQKRGPKIRLAGHFRGTPRNLLEVLQHGLRYTKWIVTDKLSGGVMLTDTNLGG